MGRATDGIRRNPQRVENGCVYFQQMLQRSKPFSKTVFCSTFVEFMYFLQPKQMEAGLKNQKIKHLETLLQKDLGRLSDEEMKILVSMSISRILVDSSLESGQKPTFGERLADKIAEFGGSWTFIISFGLFITGWISINVWLFLNKGFDPYPFILLNLILSCLAALQAPVIMMSQNRQEQKDRERAKNDYEINLRAELEIRLLHEKLDFVIQQLTVKK